MKGGGELIVGAKTPPTRDKLEDNYQRRPTLSAYTDIITHIEEKIKYVYGRARARARKAYTSAATITGEWLRVIIVVVVVGHSKFHRKLIEQRRRAEKNNNLIIIIHVRGGCTLSVK